MQTEKRHIYSDNDLLERFVLDRVGPEERLAIESHLRTCRTCKRAVRQEMDIVNGARRLGRDELKKRLHIRLLENPHREISWYSVAGAAAVIVVIIGVGIHYEWFGPAASKHMTETGEITQRLDKESPPPPELVGKVPQAPPAVTDQVKKQDRKLTKEERFADRATESKIGSEKDRLHKVQPPSAKPRHETESPEGTRNIALAAGTSSQSYWIDGVILGEGAARQGIANEALEKGKVSPASPGKRDTVHIVNGQRIRLRQQPSQSLPTSRQQLQRKEKAPVVETLVEQRDNEVQMTLYLDPPLDESVIQHAGLERVEPDSMILTLGDRRIGYHMPTGWDTQQQGRTRR